MKTVFALALLLAALLQPASPESLPEFTAALLKPSPPVPPPSPRPGLPRGVIFHLQGGPGSDDPAELRCTSCSLDFLIKQAYELSPEAVSDPDWTYFERYDLIAKVPVGSSPHQVNLMLRQLLAERFQLVSHYVTKELPGYVLEVGKQPAKLQAASAAGSTTIEPIFEGCRFQILAHGQSMSQLADVLSAAVRAPIVDRTGLQGNFDFRLSWIAADRLVHCPKSDLPGGRDAFDAVKRQLGLKITARRVTQNALVVESALKVPTGN